MWMYICVNVCVTRGIYRQQVLVNIIHTHIYVEALRSDLGSCWVGRETCEGERERHSMCA